ncbi:hypothetical protein WR25_16288 [Diploscapter pachys]|uniref:MOSC domain-containing protein n=1 Tax=Diploscapter pachys TaxID=2018661 RepID=A0A2A2KIL9_9BILA|nr:hypothetical protein WR25_16288 [Diploscapter pachys]
MFKYGLYTERYFESEDAYWNNPVPKRKDDIPYYDFSPYLVTTMSSLDELNKRLDEPVTIRNFRPVIAVEGCPPWDEDKWAEIRIGEAKMICYRPCTRCVVTTVDPDTGIKNPNMQPLKALREFRLAPEGKMRDRFKDSPVFGVQTGLNSEGYIHVGQTVYARYKPSAF